FLHVYLYIGRRRSLIRSVLEQKRGFELTLPDCVRQVRRTSGDFAPSIEVQQLYRHLLDCRSGLVALRSPPFSAEGVEPRRRCVGGDIGRRSIALDLIDAVQRNIEPIAALV